MGEHSPRPWKAVANAWANYPNEEWIVVDADGEWVADVGCEDEYHQEHGPNARLIASAPDLLRQRDALLEALEGLYGHTRKNHQIAGLNAAAEAAIALVRVEEE